MEIIEANTIKLMKRNITRESQTNDKTSRNQVLLYKFPQKDTQLGVVPCKWLGTILKMDQGDKWTEE